MGEQLPMHDNLVAVMTKSMKNLKQLLLLDWLFTCSSNEAPPGVSLQHYNLPKSLKIVSSAPLK